MLSIVIWKSCGNFIDMATFYWIRYLFRRKWWKKAQNKPFLRFLKFASSDFDGTFRKCFESHKLKSLVTCSPIFWYELQWGWLVEGLLIKLFFLIFCMEFKGDDKVLEVVNTKISERICLPVFRGKWAQNGLKMRLFEFWTKLPYCVFTNFLQEV